MAATSFSDLEELLEVDHEVDTVERGLVCSSRFFRGAMVFGTMTLVAATIWSVRGNDAKAAHGSLVTLQENECFETGMYFADPVKLPGSERTVEFSAEACQQRCQVLDDCAHFTFWPDGGCLLTAEISYPKTTPQKYAATVSGPKFCGLPDGDDDAVAATDGTSGLVAPDSGSSGLVAPDSGSSGLVAPDSGSSGLVAPVVLPATLAPLPALPDTATLKPLAIAMVPGINGTSCNLYPACLDAGITEGDCCPNAEQVSLGCCNGFAAQAVEVKVAAGTECSLFPNCVALNITAGACCPTADGIQLGCCQSI